MKIGLQFGSGNNALGPTTPSSAGRRAPVRVSEDARMHLNLRRLVAGFTADPLLQEDLLQECLVWLWQVEVEKPGQTMSWYLQNCRFRIQHWLAAGRSVDSPKRARGDARVSIDCNPEESALDGYHTDGDLFEAISIQDFVLTLERCLKKRERAVLHGLVDGFTLSEIAARVGLSYPTALKYSRKIADLAVRLGLVARMPTRRNARPDS